MASVFVLLEAFNRKEAAALGFFPCATASFLCQRVVWRRHDDEGRPGKGNVFKHRVVAGVADESYVEPFLGHGLPHPGQADAHSGPCKGNGKSADDIFTLP